MAAVGRLTDALVERRGWLANAPRQRVKPGP
jgi:hypothetical protein